MSIATTPPFTVGDLTARADEARTFLTFHRVAQATGRNAISFSQTDRWQGWSATATSRRVCCAPRNRSVCSCARIGGPPSPRLYGVCQPCRTVDA